MRPDVRRVAATLLTFAALLAVLVAPATAQPAGSSRLVLTHLTPVIGPGAGSTEGGIDSLTLRALLYLDPDGPALTDVDLVVETFGRLTSRSALHQALRDGARSPRQVIEREPLIGGEPLGAGQVVGGEIVIAADRIAPRGAGGVYPIQVSVVRGTTVLDQVTTAAVHLDEPPANPLRAAMIWPITGAPSSSLDGTVPNATVDELRPGGRLAALIAALEATGGAGIVPEVSAHLLDGLQASAQAAGGSADAAADAGTRSASEVAADREEIIATSLERLRALVVTSPFAPVAGPRADADLSALVGPRLGELAGRLATGARDDLARLTGRSPEPTSFLSVAPLSTAALDLLPGQHLLVPYHHLDGPDPRLDPDLPPATRTVRGASGRELVVTVADPYVTDRLSGTDPVHGPVAAVQDVLAETAMIYFETPGIAERPLLMLPQRNWDPGDGVAQRLATLLPRSPWLRLVDTASLTEVPAETEGTVAAGAPELPAVTVERLVAALDRLTTARDALVAGETTIAGHPTEALQDAIGRAATVAWADEPELATGLLTTVTDRIAAAYGTLEVPTGSGITLTAEEVPLPVTIRRDGGEALEVEIEVVSRGSLDFPNGSVQQLVLEPDASQTVSFVARSRSRGTLPVTVIVRSRGGEIEFTRASLTVNSQVVSRPALIAVAAVVVLLLLLGRRRRRPGPPPPGELVVVSSDAGDDGGARSARGRGDEPGR